MSFTECVDFTSHIYSPLQDRVFESKEYEFWRKQSHTWRLRLIGAPGSGKTALALSIAERLQNELRDHNACVVSMFFTARSHEPCAQLRHAFLAGLLNQMGHDGKTITPSPHISTSDDECSDSMAIEDARVKATDRCAIFSQVFLIIDALDLCSIEQTNALEEELTLLQDHRVAILTTSRIALWSPMYKYECDVGEPGCTASRLVLWQCSCNSTSHLAYCDNCKENGYQCQECCGKSEIRMPFAFGDLDVTVNDLLMRDFVAHELELAHGDLGLASSVGRMPPHSKLGRAFVASQSATATISKTLLNKIVVGAEKNIALAKIFVEHCEDFEEVEDVLRYADRLPENMFAYFDQCVESSFQSDAQVDDQHGLRAIIWSALADNGTLKDLQDWFLTSWQEKQENYAAAKEQLLSREAFLHAARGFLTFEVGPQPGYFRRYAEWFKQYILDDYNPKVYAVRQRLSITDLVGM